MPTSRSQSSLQRTMSAFRAFAEKILARRGIELSTQTARKRKKVKTNGGQISEINPGVHSGVSCIIGSNELEYLPTASLTVSLTVSCSSELSYLSTINLQNLESDQFRQRNLIRPQDNHE